MMVFDFFPNKLIISYYCGSLWLLIGMSITAEKED